MKDRIRKPIAAELLTVRYVPSVFLAHAVRILLVVSLFVVCTLSARPAQATPVIQLMTPQSGPVGTLVAIVGSGFGASQGTSTVMFNGTPVTWVSWSATSLQVQVPAGATSGNVVVTVSGKASNTKSFTITPPPVISSLSPTSGPVGATVVITGSNFTAGGTQSPQVVFNPELFASPISFTDTSITVSVPTGASTGDLLVSVGGGNSNSIFFTVTSSYPSTSSVAPSAGVVGTTVTITGTNFGSSQGTSTVTFNGTTGIPTSWNATSINVTVPTGATTGNVLVTVGGVASNPYGFEVGTAAPNITSISPTSGAVATSVTIKGTGFGSTQGTNIVSFNGVSGVPTSWSATQIKVPVPASATTGSVVVTASGTVSNAVSFSVPGTGPSVTSLSPSSGPVGAFVTITGANFGATQGASTVAFNGIAVIAAGWSPTSILVIVPSGATTGNLVVTVSGTASSGLNFTVVPSITSLSPTSGADGTIVTINGNSFRSSQGTSTVKFNGTAANPTTWGASSITVPVPAGAVTGNVVVTVGGVASNAVSFSVVSLTSLSITPQNPTIQAGNTQQFIVTGTYSDNSTQNLTATATWTSSATGIATINNAGLATGVGSGQTTIQATVGSVQASTFLTVSGLTVPGFTLTGNLITGRNGQTATLLSGGVVLIVGGYDISGNSLSSAELYNQNTGTFTATGNLNIARKSHTASLLDDGTVLIVGGFDAGGNLLSSAEVYSPLTGVFQLIGSLTTPRANHTATLLSNGRVLVVGGYDAYGNTSNTAEVYDPSSESFSSTGGLNVARGYHSAILLNDSTVLVSGGAANGGILGSAEIYNPVSGTFAQIGSLNTGRTGDTATLLNSGMVLITGGQDANSNALMSAELYNPLSQTFALTGTLNVARANHAATLLNNGMVLIEGGFGSTTDMMATAELYDPVAGTFSQTGSLNVARQVHTATLLKNGLVLVVGGFSDSVSALSSAELYQPATFVPPNLISIAVSSLNTSIPAGTAQGFAAVGTFSDNGTQTLASATWSSSNVAVATVSSDSGNHGVGLGVATGLVTVSACTGSICGSSPVTVNASTPSIAGLSPSSGPSGSLITMTGSNFGSIQGTSTVSFGGAPSVPTSWSATQVVVPVPTEAISGNVVLKAGGVPSNGVNFTVNVSGLGGPPAITSVSPTMAPAGSVVLIEGANFGSTQGTSTLTFGGTLVMPLFWSDGAIVLSLPSFLSPGVQSVVIATDAGASPAAQFNVEALSITGISPSAGAIGTQVIISGTGFGTNQARSGFVVFNGVQATPTSWTDSQIVTPVPNGATSGNVQFVVTFGGAHTSGGNFTVLSAVASGPSISASSAPMPNSNGWNNTNVIVTFTCTPGSAVISNCTSQQTLSTDGTNQVVTGTVTDSVGASASTSVTINLDETPPALVVTSPADGASLSESVVAVSGVASDSLSGLASVSCNGAVVLVTSGQFSCNISLNPGLNAVVVRATDVAGNVAAWIMHLTFATALPAPSSLQISPQAVNLVAGQMQTFVVIDGNNMARSDATWTVSDTSLATISTDSSPDLKAVAPGQVTLTATVQGVTAQTTVNILSGTALQPGATLWTAPPIAGSTCATIVQAVGTLLGTPDLYCVGNDSNGNVFVQALSSNGMFFWQETVAANASLLHAIPDSNGGLIIDFEMGGQTTLQISRVDLDGLTGSVVWQMSGGSTFGASSAIRQDGSIATSQSPIYFDDSTITGSTNYLNISGGATGALIFSLPLPPSSLICPYSTGPQTTYDGATSIGPVVDSNGTTFLLYETGYGFGQGSDCPNGNVAEPIAGSASLNLVQVSSDGAVTTQVLSSGPAIPPLGPALIPDGQGGILFTTLNEGAVEYFINHVPASSSTFSTLNLPSLSASASNVNLVLGENGTAFATDTMQIVAFNADSGQALWTYEAAPPNTISLIASTADGGVVAKTTDLSGVDTIIRLDSTGTATTDPWTGSSLNYWGGDIWPGVPSSGGPATGYAAGMVQTSSASWATLGAGGAQKASPNHSVSNFSTSGQNQTTITNVLQYLQAALPLYNSCNEWLQGHSDPDHQGLTGISGLQWTQSLLQTPTSYGHATMYLGLDATKRDYLTTAFSALLNPDHKSVPGLPFSPAPAFTVNDIGAFFNKTYTNSQGQQLGYVNGPRHYPGNDIRSQLLTVIHEEAHELNVAEFNQNDNGKEPLVEANDQMVDSHCRGLIEGPSIQSLSPSSGSAGTTVVTITGINFGQPQGPSTITFNNNVVAAPTSWMDNQIVVTVPVGAQTGNIVVTVGGAGGRSASKSFTIQ
jgi:hypothetical protein